MNLDDAVERAITECIKEGILAEFLEKNRAEAKSVSIYEYDQEKHLRLEREEAKKEGITEATNQINQLNQWLARQNRTDDIVKSAGDPEYQKMLLEEFSTKGNS